MHTSVTPRLAVRLQTDPRRTATAPDPMQWDCNPEVEGVLMTTMNVTVVSRAPLDGITEAYSTARLERATLSDGQQVVLKTLTAEGDWLTRVSGGTDRPRRLWDSGLFGRIGSVIDHTVIDIWEAGGRDVIVMRDASDELVPPRRPVTRQQSRKLLAGLAALHAAGRSEPVQELCPIGARYGMFAPALLANDPGPGAHPSTEWILSGWEMFDDLVDAGVADAMHAVHADPSLVGRPLATFAPTVVHGDAKLANLGIGGSRVVAVDWGELTGFGPPEVDVAWYALMNTSRIGGSPDDAFADYEDVADRPLDREALDLACIGSLAQMGFRMAKLSVTARTPESRDASAAELEWWTARVRATLDRSALV